MPRPLHWFLFIALSVLGFLAARPAVAQVYPVQVTVQALPPYPIYLREFAAPTAASDRLRLQLLLTDLTVPTRQVRLKMKLSNTNGSTVIQNGDVVARALPLQLSGGLPLYLGSADLDPYFAPENLPGLSPTAYTQPLPEGVYQLCFEVFDYLSGERLSGPSCFTLSIIQNDPPQLAQPRDREAVALANPQSLLFQWTPRAIGASAVEYEFTLVEQADAQLPPQVAVLSPPLYQTTTAATSLYLGPLEAPLQPGHRYCWRVQAQARAGTETVGTFKNNGYSEVWSFRVTDATCTAPTGLIATEQAKRSLKLGWTAVPDPVPAYRLSYRVHESSSVNGGTWYDRPAATNNLQIFDLDPATEYEVRVGRPCPGGDYVFGNSIYARTRSATDSATNTSCGLPPNPVDVSNTSPLASLSPAEKFTAGDFEVTAVEVTGSGGTYSGKGYITVPYLANAKVKVKWDGIKINSGRKLVQGVVETTWDPTMKGITDIDGVFTGGAGTGSVVTGTVATDYHTSFEIGGVGDFSFSGSDDQPVITIANHTNGGGSGLTIPAGPLPVSVSDPSGDVYVVEKGPDGHPTVVHAATPVPLAMSPAQLNTLSPDKGKVVFSKGDKTVYGFDAYLPEYEASTAWSNKYEALGTAPTYRVAAKAALAAKPDRILAQLTLNDAFLKADSVQFISGKGLRYTATYQGNNRFEVLLVGSSANDAQEVYALYPKRALPGGTAAPRGQYLSLGKLLVAGYAPKTAKVVVVPVNGAAVNTDSVRAALARAYTPLGITWEVQQAAAWTDSGWDANHDGKLKVTGTSGWSVYTSEMTALNAAYQAAHPLVSGAAYLFVLPGVADNGGSATSGDVAGDMPRGKRFGYLFAGSLTNSTVGRVAAHELGHGVLKLLHTFDNAYGFSPGALAQNLMSYGSGDRLSKVQWDAAHAPGLVIGLWETEQDAMSYGTRDRRIPLAWRNTRDSSVNFLTPHKQIVRLPKKVIQAYFTFGTGEYPSFPDMPAGVLKSFLVAEGKDTLSYEAVISNGQFTGYYRNGSPYTGYLAKDAAVEDGTAVMLLPYANGFKAYRLKGLTALSYMTSNPTAPVINVLDATSAKLPAQAWEELTDFSFDREQVRTGISSTLINPAFTDILTDLSNKNEEYLTLTKIMEYRTIYPDIFDRMTTTFGNWGPVSNWLLVNFNDFLNISDASGQINMLMGKEKEQITAGYFDYKCYQNGWGRLSRPTLYAKFLATFKEAINSFQISNRATIALLTNTTFCSNSSNEDSWFGAGTPPSAEAIRDAVVAMSVEQLKTICPVKRAEAIAVVLDKFIVSEPYENAIYKLMWTCPQTETKTEEFLQQLNDLTYKGKHLLGTLASAIDDRTLFMGSDLNTYVMDYFKEAYKTAIAHKNSAFYNTYLKNILEKPNTDADYYSVMAGRVVTYNYVSFGKRLFKTLANAALGSAAVPVTGTNVKTVVEYNESTGKLKYANQEVNAFIPVATFGSRVFDPFEPIILDVKGNLIDVYGDGDRTPYVPAYLLYFAEKKADARTTQAAVQTAADAISLVIPGAQATLALRLLNYADKLSSVCSIVGTMADEDYPQLAKILNISSAALGITTLTANLSLARLKNVAGSSDRAANMIEAGSHLNAATHTTDVEALCRSVTTANAGSEVANALGNAKVRAFLLRMLEEEKAAARVSGKTSLVEKLEAATAKIISGYAITSKASLVSLLQSKFPKLTGLFARDGHYLLEGGYLKYVNAEKGIAPTAIAQLTSDGKNVTVLDNIANNTLPANIANNIEEVTEEAALICRNGACELVEGGCFAAGTPVATPRGLRAIETLQEGDSVRAYSEATGAWGWGRVAQRVTRAAGRLYYAVCGRDTLRSTGDHPYYTRSGWQPAKALKRGTELLLASGLWAAVSATGYADSGALVYNIEVLPQHTYAVGRDGLLVHNGFTCFKKKYPNLANASDEFFRNFGGDANMLAQFDNGTFSYAAWDMLEAYPNLRKEALYLNKAKAVLNKGHISAADLKTMVAVNDQLRGRATALTDFLDDLDNFAQYRNQSGFNSLVSSLKAGNFNGAGADGANWVISALRKEGTSVFPALSTNFEVSVDINGSIRRYDAIVGQRGSRTGLYFEFKSYKSVPPAEFSTQFINDLNNIDIGSLSQLKWYFDAAKNPSNFLSNMTNAIDAMDMSSVLPQTFAKFGAANAADLKLLIKNNISTIFQVK
ncbi:fibronectin type III domain-containing protein [Hymenobacter sp. BT664]|uniref:Fibronectin type III domain-containing protein n=1 Tax=Hymenobacter montanus TaxID=2771359 RepID=A0A927BFN0_9BACT|nr:polymorphic toxin-type HINT domain-containing protein [Hymenobacter montanus]MBD2769203.1 fibronectin type III domain-containing protein [Hymenobacter montanus]